MERELSVAATVGNVELLIQLLQEDPLILDRTIVSCVSETPLHSASMLGHVAFVKELLNRKPEFASELDSLGCSPLHLASAKGHLEIVKSLLVADPEMLMVRNLDGRTALHVAAAKGRVEVVTELIRVKSESTRLLTDRSETVLHLCVTRNRLEVLKSLSGSMKGETELVNWKDSDGNTILHIAVTNKHIETINFLLTINGLEVNALNVNGSTALDILTQSPRDLKDMEIEDLLKNAGALCVKELHLITSDLVLPKPTHQITKEPSSEESIKNKEENKPEVKLKHTDWLGRKRSALMVVASLIATVAFQSALTPPGGVWQDDYLVDSNGNPVQNPHTVGTAVMAYADFAYGLFMIFNTLAFLSSLSIILLLVSGLPLNRRRWMWVQMVIIWIAISAQVATYFLALRHMSPKDDGTRSTLRQVTAISVLTWFALMGVVFIGNFVRMLWILRKHSYIKEKEKEHSTAADDTQEV